MKGSEAKFSHQEKVLPDYERKRIERLKYNADFMEARGFKGLATKIYEKRAGIQFPNVQEEDSSDEDEYMLVFHSI